MLTKQQIPFVRIVLFFIFGILCADFVQLPYLSLFLVGIIVLSIPIYFINKKWSIQHRWVPGILLMFLVFTTGFISYNIHNSKNHYDYIGQHSANPNYIQLELLEQPKFGKKIKFLANANYVIDSNSILIPTSGKIICYLDTTDFKFDLRIGDQILTNTKLYPIKSNLNPGSFDYKSFLFYKQTNFQTFLNFKNIYDLQHKQYTSTYEHTQIWRQHLHQVLIHNIHNKDNLGILSAMVLGIKSDLDDKLYESFSNSGAIHILAVSGLHVGFIAMIIYFLLNFYSSSSTKIKILKKVILVIAIIIYGMITGMAPAIMRAIVMYSIYIIAKSWRPHTNNLNIFAFTAFIMLLYNPFMIFQAGFQFSFLAILGILVFFQPIRSLIKSRYTIIAYLRDMVALSLSAQIFIFPITIYYFHKFPTYFFISGLFAIPLAAVILALGISMIGFHYIFPWLNEILITPLLNVVLSILITGIKWMNKWPYAHIDGIFLDKTQLYSIYLLILFSVFYKYLRIRKLIIASLMSILFILTINISQKISYSKNADFIIYDSYKKTCIDIFIKNRCYSIQSKNFTTKTIKYLTENYRLQKSISNTVKIQLNEPFSDDLINYNNNIIQTGSKLFYIAYDNHISSLNKDICIDYLILTKGTNLDLQAYIEKLHPNQIIIDHSIQNKQIRRWEQEALDYNKNIHIISKNGVFMDILD